MQNCHGVLVRAHTIASGSGGSWKPLASQCCRGIRDNISGVVHLPFSYIQCGTVSTSLWLHHTKALREGRGGWAEIRLTVTSGLGTIIKKTDAFD